MTWWRHQMETKASDAELWCFSLDLHMIKQLSKQSPGWWFETPSRPLWRHCNACPICSMKNYGNIVLSRWRIIIKSRIQISPKFSICLHWPNKRFANNPNHFIGHKYLTFSSALKCFWHWVRRVVLTYFNSKCGSKYITSQSVDGNLYASMQHWYYDIPYFYICHEPLVRQWFMLMHASYSMGFKVLILWYLCIMILSHSMRYIDFTWISMMDENVLFYIKW